MIDFKTNLQFGVVAESKIVRWLRRKGWCVQPAYNTEKGNHKGPRLFTPQEELILPDILAIGKTTARWVEAKHKNKFTWHRYTQKWQTGIDIRHYEHYMKVANITPFSVWIFFFHDNDKPSQEDLLSGSPVSCPTGLFGNEISILSGKIDHRSNRHGNSGMVYWDHENLVLIASVETFENEIA